MQLPTDYQQMIHTSRYARWIEKEHRRETWTETVKRYFDFMENHLKEECNYKLKKSLRNELEQSVLRLDVLPSMRCLATAGPALDRCNVAGYNCSYLPIESPRCFDELFYILLCGTGVGYSVERQYTNQLPAVSEHFEKSSTVLTVDDSKSGWARSLKELIALLYQGQIPSWDVSKVRPKGARLKTFGGRASGPGPLVELFKYTVNLFQGAAGRKLNSIECHDLCCKIAAAVVVGGVRRSAMISLSNLSDPRMRDAKTGEWFRLHPDRSFANNSVVYTEKPDMGIFMSEWKSLYDSHSGERGIFNRVASKNQASNNGRRDTGFEFGTNPCSEIILRPYQFCNLTEVVVRAEDTVATLTAKVRLATILGTFQSTLTNFKYLRKVWQKNTEEERLLGVSLTGICDNPLTYNTNLLDESDEPAGFPRSLDGRLALLKDVAIQTNKEFADELDIPVSAAITCVKPSGTVSQLVNAASGIHPRHSVYYVRRVRGDSSDPLATFLKDQGVPTEPCAYKPDSTVIFSFPIAGSSEALTRHKLNALQQLQLWKTYQEAWCEHKPSITVYVKDAEWMEVGAWVYKHFDAISGISFLPYDGGTYVQAPYTEITEAEYNELAAAMPKNIDWGRLKEFEKEDGTIAAQEFACVGGVCELVDIQK